MKNFRFIETFRDIKEALQKEVDLLGEQNNLKKAAWFYGKEKTAAIPILLPFSTENMTAMEHMRGGKITDGHIQPENKKKLAQMLFKSVIWRPLFSRQERTLFHGDPHAGNIYAYEENQGKIKLILLDWSQTGELSKKQRISIFTLAIGIFLEDKQLICKAINELSQDKDLPEEPYLKKMLQIIEDISDSPQYRQCKMIQSIFFVIDQMVIQGIRFPKDLLLLRKAFFTLEGVLYDLDPEFDMDRYVLKLIESLFIEELPKRWLYFLFPQSDNWNHYKSLMSNHDVQALVNRIFMKCLQKGITRIADHILPAPIHR